MIEVTNLSKTFNEKQILTDISVTFYKGKTNLIIGASGTGKSVLLKCIVGLVRPETGTVLFDNRNFWSADKETVKEIRREMGMLFQGGALFDFKTVKDNIMFPLNMLSEMGKSEKEDRVAFCLRRVGLEKAANLFPSEISGGMQKRVGIARSIVMNPRYLFCDEPNSGLDPITAITIDELIQEITHEFDTTTIIVTHDMNSVVSIGEHIVYLNKGMKEWEGDMNNIFETKSEQLQKFIFANKLIKEYKNAST